MGAVLSQLLSGDPTVIIIAAVSVGAILVLPKLLQQQQHPKQSLKASSKKTPHVKARTPQYIDGPKRTPVPDDKVSWDAEFPDYKPVEYTSSKVLAAPVWADTPEVSNIQFNTVDGKVDRKSFEGPYQLIDGLPRNPRGRTGIKGRGTLGRWGPNHAADPIVTRWKRNDAGKIETDANGKKILQVVLVTRRDTGELAIPGGMVDPGENVSLTLKREFGEEALNSLEASEEQKKNIEDKLNEAFDNGVTIYQGYVDDPRNTDNAWMETVACLFHDDSGEGLGRFPLQAGDDASNVAWHTYASDIKLYASHADFIRRCYEHLVK